jgi:diguanylate cyclase (GGDEF)-like protein/PAS domain S-box-containing protein
MHFAQKVETILIVEDSPTQAQHLRNILELHGYVAYVAHSGQQGLEIVRSLLPSLVITDIVMPDMNGYQLCAAIREDDSLQSVPVMLLTLLSGTRDIIMALECGADFFVTKPYKQEYLLSKIKSVFSSTSRVHVKSESAATKIVYEGDDFSINSDMPRMLDLLVSTYESSAAKNQELLEVLQERRQAEEALRESEERFRNIFDNAPIGMAVVSLDGKFTLVNHALCEIVGYEKEELENTTFQQITYHEDLASDLANMQGLLADSALSYQMEKRYIRKDLRAVWTQLTVSLQKDRKGAPLYFISQIEDISERKQHLEQIHQLAYYDALTKLPNRRLLKDRLNQALNQAKHFQRSMALMFLDLDNFKQVNDTFGHEFGDELLKVVAKRLLDCVRSADTVCRQGGDEFIIVLEEISHPEDAQFVAGKILAAVSKPIDIRENTLSMTMSIGIVVYPVDGADDVKALMKKADMAMYQTKNKGRNGFTIC